jgi:hypothetical protein
MTHIDLCNEIADEYEKFLESVSATPDFDEVRGNHACDFMPARFDCVSYPEQEAVANASNNEFLILWNEILSGLNEIDSAILSLSFDDNFEELMTTEQIAYAYGLDPQWVAERKEMLFSNLQNDLRIQTRAKESFQIKR